MEAINLPQPRIMETSCEAKCKKCLKVVYVETIVEHEGKPVERIITGNFKQALDLDGNPTGAVIPFCDC